MQLVEFICFIMYTKIFLVWTINFLKQKILFYPTLFLQTGNTHIGVGSVWDSSACEHCDSYYLLGNAYTTDVMG